MITCHQRILIRYDQNKTNFDALLNPDNACVLTQEATHSVWNAISDNLFTQGIFLGLLTRACQCVVHEEAMGYLPDLVNLQKVEDYLVITNLINQIKNNNSYVVTIWDKIKDRVSSRIYGEFGSLYHNKANHSFTGLVDVGQYTILENLSCFPQQIQGSAGNQQYCSQILRQSESAQSADYLNEHRHDSLEAYDKPC